MTLYHAAGLAVLSGLASLDRLAGLNIMLSRPFVVAGIVGFAFDKVAICLFVGILFEFIGMLEVPVGTSITNDDTFGGYASALLVATGAASYNAVSLLFCVCLTVIMMYPVTLSDRYCRDFNRWLISESVKSNKSDFESKLISYGLVISFLRGVVVYNLAAAVIWCFLYVIDRIHDTSYSPSLSLILLFTFMGGYLVRFFSVNTFLKAALLVGGMAFGWLVL